jgi:hypothetical protein
VPNEPTATPAATDEPTNSSPTSSGANAPPAQPEPLKEFRYGDEAPSYLRGKTAAEAAEITDQLYKQVVAQQSMAPLPQQGGPLYAQQVTPTYDPNDPMAATRQYITPELQMRDAILGGQARELAAMKYPDDFRRWGHEIDQSLLQIAPAQRTPQVVDWIVAGVRGRHVDDLINEKAKTRLEELVSSGQLRPQGTGDGASEAASNRIDFDKLPPRYGALLKNLGMNQSTADQYLRKIYPDMPLVKAREKWFKAASNGDIITDGLGGKYSYGENPDDETA